MSARDIIAIGGSAGAIQEVRALVARLPPDFPGSLFVVIHTSAEGPGLLAQVLERASKMPTRSPVHGEAVKPSHIYVAPPNRHLLLVDGHIELGKGPRENGFRPAVDPLFRTAVNAYAQRVVGVVLSGGMSDGSLGLQLIIQRGGIAIVQDPSEAVHPNMPENAMRATAVDYVSTTKDLPRILTKLARHGHSGGAIMKPPPHSPQKQPSDPAILADLSNAALNGPPSGFICPECGGSLWQLSQGGLLHYRCHVGHGYTADALAKGQENEVEEALWVALRSLEETAALRRRLAVQSRERDMRHVAEGFEASAQEYDDQAGVIRQILLHDKLPPKLRGFGSPRPSKFLSETARQTTIPHAGNGAGHHPKRIRNHVK